MLVELLGKYVSIVYNSDTAIFSFSEKRTVFQHSRAGVPNLSLNMYPFSIPTDKHVPPQHFNR